LKHKLSVRSAQFSPDGRWIVTATGDFSSVAELLNPMSDPRKSGAARVWEAATGRPATGSIRHQGVVQHAMFSPDGSRLLTISVGRSSLLKQVQLWNPVNGRPLSPPFAHSQGRQEVSFSPDGRLLATGSLDGTVRIWEAATAKPLLT